MRLLSRRRETCEITAPDVERPDRDTCSGEEPRPEDGARDLARRVADAALNAHREHVPF